MALQASPARAQEVGLPAEPRLALAAAAALALALWAAKSLASVPFLGPAALTAVVFAQLWWPVSRCDHHSRPTSAIGLSWAPPAAGGTGEKVGGSPSKSFARSFGRSFARSFGRSFARSFGRSFGTDLAEAAAILAIVLPLYAWGAALWWGGGGQRLAEWTQQLGLQTGALGELATSSWRLVSPPPPTTWAWSKVATAFVGQTFGVALPEEAFFRGYLLPQLRHIWPPVGRPLRRATGAAAALSALMFALGHWLGEWHPGRLLTFFPALLFGAVACRQRSLTGAIFLHAGCNLFAHGLAICLQRVG